MGSDIYSNSAASKAFYFNSRPPAWGAIQPERQDRQYHLISILVPRVGSDNIESHAFIIIINFNSRSLCGERYHGISAAGAPVDFNSRPLRGERYVTGQSNIDIIVISILDSCVGSGRNVLPDARDESDFNSRSLFRERLRQIDGKVDFLQISILAPCVGSDTQLAKEVAPPVNFNSRSLCGARYHAFFNNKKPCLFQFSLPAWGAISGR